MSGLISRSESRRKSPLFCAVTGIMLLLFMFSERACGGWTLKLSWDQLEKNMAAEEVEKILGLPKETEQINQRTVWYYQQTPVRQEGRIISRPKEGYVVFLQLNSHPVTRQPLDKPGLFAANWVEPNWRTITEAERKADFLSPGNMEPELSPEMQQWQEELRQRQEQQQQHIDEQMRRMDEEQKKRDEQFQRQHQETMDRIAKQQEEMQQRMRDARSSAAPQQQAAPQTGLSPDPVSPSRPTVEQPQPPGSMERRKAASMVGFVVGILVAIALLIAVFPALMILVVKLISGLKVTWWTCLKAYVVAHLLGLVAVKASEIIAKTMQLDPLKKLLLGLAFFISSSLLYGFVYNLMIQDENHQRVGFPKGVLLALIIDILPLVILMLVFS